jgi:hypothetical protein
MVQHDHRHVRAMGNLAQRAGQQVCSLVRVFGEGVQRTKRIENDHVQLCRHRPLNQPVHHARHDFRPVLASPCELQLQVAARSHKQVFVQVGVGQPEVLQGGGQTALHILQIILGVVGPNPQRADGLFAHQKFPAGRHRHRFDHRKRRFSGTARCD